MMDEQTTQLIQTVMTMMVLSTGAGLVKPVMLQENKQDVSIAKCLWAYDKFRDEIEGVKKGVDIVDVLGPDAMMKELHYAQIGAERVCRVCPISESTKRALLNLEADIKKTVLARDLTTLEMGKETVKAQLHSYPEMVMIDMAKILRKAGEYSFQEAR